MGPFQIRGGVKSQGRHCHANFNFVHTRLLQSCFHCARNVEQWYAQSVYLLQLQRDMPCALQHQQAPLL